MCSIRNSEPSYIQVYGTESKFGLSQYADSTGRKPPLYELNKSQTLFLVSGYDAVLRAKIQNRWEELENKAQLIYWNKQRNEKYGFIENEYYISFRNFMKRETGTLIRKRKVFRP